MRTQFAFYKSFDDVYQDLTDKQKLEFVNTILDVQFLRVKIDDVAFKDIILKHIWNAQKHSIEKSIKGYLESQKNSKIKSPFLGVYDPLLIPSQGVHKEEQEKEEEQVKEKCTNKQEALPKKKPKDYLYPKNFETLWKMYSHDVKGDKWKGYVSAKKRIDEGYKLEELVNVLKMENQKQFAKRHFSTIMNGDIDMVETKEVFKRVGCES